MNPLKLAFYLALYLALSAAPTYASVLVLPNDRASALGHTDSGPLDGSVPDIVLQDIWDASQFASVGGSMWITEYAWRMKPGTGSIHATATSFSLYMSTTSFSPGTITTNFATNRGPDHTLVASGSGTLWSSPGCPGPAICPFDVVFPLSTPFVFDPSRGNLLVELQVSGYNGVGTGRFDVQNYPSANGATVGELVGPAGSPTGTVVYSSGVTQLTYTTAPEPGAYLLTLCGVVAFAAVRRLWKS